MLYDVTMELFNRLYYRMYAWDLGLMRSCFLRTFVGRAFTFSEVKFLESMDRYVATELVFKMCLLHHISNDEDALLLANHNVPRLVGLYQSLAFKVSIWLLNLSFEKLQKKPQIDSSLMFARSLLKPIYLS